MAEINDYDTMAEPPKKPDSTKAWGAGETNPPESTPEQKPKNDTGDLALLAEFYAEQFGQRVKSASESAKGRLQKEADEMARVHSIIADLAKNRFSAPDKAFKMLDGLEQDYVDAMDNPSSDEEAMEIDKGVAAVRRARTFLEQNQNTDVYGRKNFSDWLKERNARLREVRKVEDQKREQEAAGKTAEKVEAVYKQLGVESPTEREKSREQVIQRVLEDGGIRVYSSLEEDATQNTLPQDKWSGYRGVSVRMEDYRKGAEAARNLNAESILDENDINELVAFRDETKPIYEDVTIPGKKGVLGIGKTPDRTERRTTGHFEPVLHSEYVSHGKREPAVRITYIARDVAKTGEQKDKYGWQDYSGREGQQMFVELVVPTSISNEIKRQIDNDPAFIRQIVERVMKEKILQNPETWTAKQRSSRDTIRPPFEKWDAKPQGARIYVQTEDMEHGFHSEGVRKIKK